MKILLVNDTYYPNVDGSAYTTHRLAIQLKKHGHEVLVIAPSRHGHSHYSEENGVPSFRVWSIPILIVDYRFSLPFFAKKHVRKAIEKFNPNIIHIQGHFILGRTAVKIAQELNIPIMGTNHFMPGNLSHFIPVPNWIRKKIENLAWLDFNSVFKKLAVVASPTQSAANILAGVNFPKEVHPVSNGIDLERFNPNNSPEAVRKKYNLPNKLILMSVSRLDKDKRINIVLRAMPRILSQCDIQFVMVGKGVEKENLEKLAEKLGVRKNVTFAGFVPDEELPNIYAAADCFVLACPYELQSLATMEAMATGKPAVVVDALALPELVHPDENGYLFPENNSRALAEAVIRIMTDKELRKKMGEKSLEIIQEHDIDRSAGKYEYFYKESIEKTVYAKIV